jgi:N-acetylglucosamine malate deacetylase 1
MSRGSTMNHLIPKLRALPIVRRVRQSAGRRYLLRLHRALLRMPSQLRTVTPGNVLVVAPHMDDEVIACGGTLLLHAATGSRVRVVYLSDSGGPVPSMRSTMRSIRRREAEVVARYVGFETEMLEFVDGDLTGQERAVGRVLARTIDAFEPSVVFCPFFTDAHADHQAAAVATSIALDLSAWRGEVWAYEVWTPIWPNVSVDITAVSQKKREAITLYDSQMQDRDYAAAALGLNRYRGLKDKVDLVEAFHVSDPSTFRRLLASTTPL